MCWLCVCSPLPVIRRGCAPCRRQLFWLAGSILAYSFYDPRPQVLELLDQRQQILAVGDARRILDQRPMPLAAILFRPFVELLGHEEGVVGDGHHTLARCRLLGHKHRDREVIKNDTLHAGFLETLTMAGFDVRLARLRSEEHTSELQSLMRTSYAV